MVRQSERPVVALIERRSSDDAVMRVARAHTVAQSAPLVLVHVAPLGRDLSPWGFRAQRGVEPWERMLGLEATVSYDLRLLAREWIGPATPVDAVVRFGDAATELAAVAEARGARVVVAHSRGARWAFGRGRDGRLRSAVKAPLTLVSTPGEARWRGRLHPIAAGARWRP